MVFEVLSFSIMWSTIHFSVQILVCCGLLGVLSTPAPLTTTISPTTTTLIMLNSTNSSQLESSGEEEPVILAEGDVDVLILSLGGILSDEESYKAKGEKNYSISEILSLLRRDTEAVASEEESFLLNDEKSEPDCSVCGTEVQGSTEITTNENTTLPSINERKKRSFGEFSPLTLLSNRLPTEEIKSTANTPTHTSDIIPTTSTSTLNRNRLPLNNKEGSISDKNMKKDVYELDKEPLKTDPKAS